jgi:hypothetical protein
MKVGDGTVWTVCIIQFSSELLLMLAAVLTTRVLLFCRDNLDTNSDRPWAKLKRLFDCMMIDVVYMNLAIGRKPLCISIR